MRKERHSLSGQVLHFLLGISVCMASIAVYAEDPPVYPEPLTPAHEAEEIISIYCSSYSNSVNLHPVTKTPVEGSYVTTPGGKTIIISQESNSSIRLDHTTVDISEQTHLHFDIYSETQGQFTFNIRDNGYRMFGNTYTDGVSTGQWISYDIPLSDNETEEFDYEHVIRFIAGTRHQNYQGTYYFDNIYYYKKEDDGGGAVGTINLEKSVYDIYFTSDNIIISAEENIKEITVYDIQGENLKNLVVNSNIADISITGLQAGTYILKVELADGKLINRKFLK